ncbi:S49 family peptidase [Magnetofaba australis]|uniref:Putative signal peptide peptidase SppA, 36K type n=1 Tax=Magnetofaba australis IT-1 TaxID=1434232 RepID=A0A1Y2K5J6_9PROT|nr:S49 family peptidase [Magnetofaba australis]OSM04951.1 putative signal peptide peptidase SppA, 36K type [Magnetofaba australis IT-1]
MSDNETDQRLQRLLTALEDNRMQERVAMQRIVGDSLREQKRARWGKNLFRLFIALYLLVFLALSIKDDLLADAESLSDADKHTAVVRIDGAILPDGQNSAEKVIEGLRAAFKDKQTSAVVVQINSPGGSAVQSGMVHDEIRRLRAKYEKIPVYAALEDMCASGGYYIASAADQIYADKATLVGSVGVVMPGMGFTEALQKLGLEDRTLTSGTHKAFLSPMQPVDETERAHAKKLLSVIHGQFIEVIKRARGERLKADDDTLFNGLFWTGEQALELGLIDGLASLEAIARDKVKAEDIVDYSSEEPLFDRFARRMGASASSALWNGMGLQLR